MSHSAVCSPLLSLHRGHTNGASSSVRYMGALLGGDIRDVVDLFASPDCIGIITHLFL